MSCLPAGQYAVNHSSTAPHCIILQIKSGQIAQILQIAELSRLHGRPIKHRICDPPFFTSHTPGPLHQGTQKQTHTLNKWYWLNWVKELMADISKSKHPTSAKENHQTHVLPSISKELQVVNLCIKRVKPQKEEFWENCSLGTKDQLLPISPPIRAAGWQNLAAFRREQKWQWKFSSSAYLQISRQMRRFCA